MIEYEKKCKQCERNIKAVLNRYKAPELELVNAEADRCFYKYSVAFEAWLYQQEGIFNACGRSWRENRSLNAMEVTIHIPHPATAASIEIDFDYFNPNYGVAVAVMHMFECLYNHLPLRKHKTDPYKIAKALNKLGIDTSVDV